MAVRITYFVHGTTTDNEKDLATGWLPGHYIPYLPNAICYNPKRFLN